MEITILVITVLIVIIYLSRKRIRKTILPEKEKYYTIDDQFNSDKREREKEIDLLLAKIGTNGIEDLSQKDRKRLEELSKK